MRDYSYLKAKTIERGFRQFEISEAIGLNPTTYSLKLNNKAEFKQSEIEKICEVLKIPPEEIRKYFFTQKV